jgi:surface protein
VAFVCLQPDGWDIIDMPPKSTKKKAKQERKLISKAEVRATLKRPAHAGVQRGDDKPKKQKGATTQGSFIRSSSSSSSEVSLPSFVQSLPLEIRRRIFPLAVRVIHSKAELIAAVDECAAAAATVVRRADGNQRPTAIDYPIGQWDVSNIRDFSYVFDARRNPLLRTFRADLSEWDTSNNATNMHGMFRDCESFDADVSGWNVSNVTDFCAMFRGCRAFNSDLSRWNVANATDLSSMFRDCEAFNSDLSGWNVSNVTDFRAMFRGCRAFNTNLSSWNVSSATNMSLMFAFCSAFNSDVSGWNVANATNLCKMFRNCEAFNSDLSGWNVSNVTNFMGMFLGCEAFNSDLSRWNVSSATDMWMMFQDCRCFDSDLSRWDVSRVNLFLYMFSGCSSFHSDISNWNVAYHAGLDCMFAECPAFDHVDEGDEGLYFIGLRQQLLFRRRRGALFR